MDDPLTLMDQNLSALVLAWRRGDLPMSQALCRRLSEQAGSSYPAIGMAAAHWQQLTQTPSLDDPVRCEAALTLLVSAVRRAHAVGEVRQVDMAHHLHVIGESGAAVAGSRGKIWRGKK